MKTPYSSVNFLKPIDCLVIDDCFDDLNAEIDFSVVISVKNESESITDYIQSIEKQTLIPDEVIFIDHNSDDDTFNKILEYSKISKINIRLFSSQETEQFKKTGRSTIAGNRNFGVSQAKNDIIVFTDCGNLLPKTYFKSLVCPMLNPTVDLVGGIFQTQDKTLDNFLVFDWNNVDWNTYIPACRGQSVRKALYMKCGGQPEWLTYAGEDAYYDYRYRRISKFWVFNKKANITWIAPDTDALINHKFYAYGIGDGENGMGNFENYALLVNFLKTTKINSNSLGKSKFLGYLEGINRRNTIDKLRGVEYCDIFILHKHPAIQKTSLDLIKKSIFMNHRVICLIVDEEQLDRKEYFDVDFSLLELWYYSDVNLGYLISKETSKIINNKVNIKIDPNNQSSKVKKIYSDLTLLLDEISVK